jgi:hypothetical protein
MFKRWWQACAPGVTMPPCHAAPSPTTFGSARWCATLPATPRAADAAELRRLTSLFLDRKEFSTTGGLRLTDAMVVAIAAQAVLPVLRLGLAATTALWASSCTPTRWWRGASRPTMTAWCTPTTKCCPAKPWKAAR